MLPHAQVLQEFNAPDVRDGGMASCCMLDPDQFQKLFERYCRPVMSFILGYLGDRDQAEELTQETFIRAYRKKNERRDDSALSTWLFGIARNVVREAIKDKYRRSRNTGLEQVEKMPSEQRSVQPDDRLMTGEMSAHIQRALNGLPEDQRLVFVLKVVNQLRYEQISSVTGYSLGKLKTDLHRARAEMRRRLIPYLGRRDS